MGNKEPFRALLSVYDKSEIVEFARGLSDLGWELISSGGTAAELLAADIPVVDVADYTGSPTMLGHRVATLHPRIHGGILANRSDAEHRAEMTEFGIDTIDLVVVNLYPFESQPSIEMIDIGGVALIRAAAKNHAHVGVATSPADYSPILAELHQSHQASGPEAQTVESDHIQPEQHSDRRRLSDTELQAVESGHRPPPLSAKTRFRLAKAAFEHTIAYDSAIAEWFSLDASSDPAVSPPAVPTPSTSTPSVPPSSPSAPLAPTPSTSVPALPPSTPPLPPFTPSTLAVPPSPPSVPPIPTPAPTVPTPPNSPSSVPIPTPAVHLSPGFETDWLADGRQVEGKALLLPEVHLKLELAESLRYGENPYQQGARYRIANQPSMWDEVEQLSGKALGYLNIYDADAAWSLVSELGGNSAAIVKHANPCGAAIAPQLHDAYQSAYECDRQSAFGGVVALSQSVTARTAEQMASAAPADVIIAPAYDEGVVETLRAKRKSTCILKVNSANPQPEPQVPHLRQITGGVLAQFPHHNRNSYGWKLVTSRQFSRREFEDAVAAWIVCAHAKSNAVVLVCNGVAWGIGAGQPSRVGAAKIALEKAAGKAVGGAFASDGFIPFEDALLVAVEARASIIVQPGGSVNDEKIIAKANELDLSMLFTAQRQFLH